MSDETIIPVTARDASEWLPPSMIKRLAAAEVLRRHAIERWLRSKLRALCIDPDARSSIPHMSMEQWLNSCGLTAGVEAMLLDCMGMRECQANLVTWNAEARTILGMVGWVDTEQVCKPLTLLQAARKMGWRVERAELKQKVTTAILRVQENQLRRKGD